MAVSTYTAAVVVAVAVMRVSMATDRLFFKDKTNVKEMNVRATVGQDVVLECEAGGSPSPTIHWLHHGRRIRQVCKPPGLYKVFVLWFYK